VAWLAAAPAAPAVDFTADVRPIFQARCVSCHGAKKQRGGLRLDRKAPALRGGDSGPVLVPGRGADSPLVRRVAAPDGAGRMPPSGKRLSAAEVALLRAWLDRGAPWPDDGSADVAASHWAYRPVRRPGVPAVADGRWPRNAVDRFVLALLEQQQLTPAPEADRRTLIRRLSFDLIGLPPAPEEVDAFVADGSPDAYERLVDRLLASPHFGERWGRHWLDVVRFAESHGFEMNQPRPNAWPYRDWVIRAFNRDLPYDRFVQEQLAGDALRADAATGFLVAGPWDQVKSPDVVLTAQQRADELHDVVATTGSAFLGLTLGCARCHNHKFDPVTQADYYAVTAVFAGVQHGERPMRPAGAGKPRKGQPTVYAGRFEQPGPTFRLSRGDPMQPREPARPGAPQALGPRLELPAAMPEQQRRLALARWVTDPGNPLAARVIVNRLWHYHFGEGLVSTPSDLGLNGARPSHPELLDWLASELVAHGWSLKHVHRLIVLSAAYRQSSRADARGLAADAAGRLLWRFPPRRLEAEALRDAVLAVSGNLDRRMGGRGFDLFEPNTSYVKVYNPKTTFGPPEWRRMVYQSKPRMQLDGVFGAFDCPDAGQVAPRRTRSTTPLQALNLLNSSFMVQQADLFAGRLRREAGPDAGAQVDRGFRLAFGRGPDPDERAAAVRLVEHEGPAAFCRALLNANEFVHVE
jgi:mono/diheme cytochrome c family protein